MKTDYFKDMKTAFMHFSSFNPLLFAWLWHIQTRGQYLNCKVKKVFICMCFLAMPMYGVTLAKVKIFLSAFLQMSEMWSSKVNFWWSIDDSNKICTYNSYSVSLLPISNPSTFKLTLPFIPICRWLFKTLFLNHSN